MYDALIATIEKMRRALRLESLREIGRNNSYRVLAVLASGGYR